MSSVCYGLKLWLIIMLEINSVICVVWAEAVVDRYAGDPQCYLCSMD